MAAVVVKAVGGVVCEHKCSLRPGCKAVFTPGWVDGRALPKIINLDVESAGCSIGSQHGFDQDGCNLHDSAPHTVVFSRCPAISSAQAALSPCWTAALNVVHFLHPICYDAPPEQRSDVLVEMAKLV